MNSSDISAVACFDLENIERKKDNCRQDLRSVEPQLIAGLLCFMQANGIVDADPLDTPKHVTIAAATAPSRMFPITFQRALNAVGPDRSLAFEKGMTNPRVAQVITGRLEKLPQGNQVSDQAIFAVAKAFLERADALIIVSDDRQPGTVDRSGNRMDGIAEAFHLPFAKKWRFRRVPTERRGRASALARRGSVVSRDVLDLVHCYRACRQRSMANGTTHDHDPPMSGSSGTTPVATCSVTATDRN